ncbi:hypothetical protein ABGB18_43460 [Nonomuraea sp. B12E4]|uniref:hypothetical protein n=1 Tax=Nonomuraea sp. B12E4 TaxID=3153564 RepID=UPI00325F23C7
MNVPERTPPEETLRLDIVDHEGRTTEATLLLCDSVPARLALTCRGLRLEVSGDDLLDCLIGLRRRLEAEGLKLCCQGARADVWPSGQLRQFTNGRLGYVLAARAPGEAFEEADLFAPARPGEIVSILHQWEAVARFHGLGRRSDAWTRRDHGVGEGVREEGARGGS